MSAIIRTLALSWALTIPVAWAANPTDDVFDLENLRVRITPDLSHLTLGRGDQAVLLMRHQDPDHRIVKPYDKTSRDCPPYCIQPMQLAPGVETVGELELIDYLRRAEAGESILVIDSRTPEWTARGMIPGAVAIPYTRLDPATAEPESIAEMMELDFGAVRTEALWNFGAAKTLILYCNGPWCGQSPTNIRALLEYGYPAQKLKWYRGGMQAWEQFGLTTVAPSGAAVGSQD